MDPAHERTGGLKPMTNGEFRKFSEFIHSECGIKLSETKKTLLEARLQKRMRLLGIDSFQRYADYVFSPEGLHGELPHMIDVVTTNKTDFFREPDHFDYLVRSALPALMARRSSVDHKRFYFWSAGCSTGEEPYTLAMVLSDYAESHPLFRFLILATDISTQVLEKARSGIYEEAKVLPVPAVMKKRYLLRSRNRHDRLVRVTPELRSQVKFAHLNLMEGDFGIREQVEVVFCRNVVIYFDRNTQQDLLRKFYRQLLPGGYLFMGHSETLSGFDLDFVPVAPTIYQKPG